MIVIKDVSKKFSKKEILKDISCTFENGIYVLLGPNGAGKTTLIRCILGLYNDFEGQIDINGNIVNKDKKYISDIGYVPQSFGLFKDYKVDEMLKYICNLKYIDKEIVDKEIDRVLQLTNLQDKKQDKIRKLSGGMIRRLEIAQALLGNPRIIIMDEPTVGLDPEERIRFQEILRKISKDNTIILSTHIVSDVENICNKFIIMSEGDILINGDKQDIKNRAEGKIYEVLADNIEDIDSDYYIEREYDNNGQIYFRILCADNLNYKRLDPTIEDGYLCVIKGI